jgi:hypothetical protein
LLFEILIWTYNRSGFSAIYNTLIQKEVGEGERGRGRAVKKYQKEKKKKKRGNSCVQLPTR